MGDLSLSHITGYFQSYVETKCPQNPKKHQILRRLGDIPIVFFNVYFSGEVGPSPSVNVENKTGILSRTMKLSEP